MSIIQILLIVIALGIVIGGLLLIKKSAKKFILSDEQLTKINKRNEKLEKEEKEEKKED